MIEVWAESENSAWPSITMLTENTRQILCGVCEEEYGLPIRSMA